MATQRCNDERTYITTISKELEKLLCDGEGESGMDDLFDFSLLKYKTRDESKKYFKLGNDKYHLKRLNCVISAYVRYTKIGMISVETSLIGIIKKCTPLSEYHTYQTISRMETKWYI